MHEAKRLLPILLFLISLCGFAQDETVKPLAVIFASGQQYGLRKPEGKMILKAAYDEVLELGPNVFSLKKNGKYGYVTLGKSAKVADPEFDFVAFDTDRHQLLTYKNGKETTMPFGAKPEVKKSRDEPYFESVRYNDNDLFTFRKNGKYGLSDRERNQKVKPIYDSIAFAEDSLFIVYKRNSSGMRLGLIDQNGKVLIPLKFPKLKLLQHNVYEAGDQNRFGLRDRLGRELFPETIDSLSAIAFGNGDTGYYLVYEAGHPAQSLLEVKNGKAVKLLENCTRIFFIRKYFNDPILNTVAFQKNGSDLYGVLDVISGRKIAPVFRKLAYDERLRILLAAKDSIPDTIIGEGLELASPGQKVIDYGNGYFIVSENAKKRALDRTFTPSGFAFDNLRPLALRTDDVAIYTHAELFDWFWYAPKGETDGIVDFSGKTIVAPGLYDAISAIGFYDHNRSKLLDNQYLQPLVNKILLAGEKRSKNKAESKITVFTPEQTLATFTIHQDETWDFCNYNDGILIQSKDSVKVFGIAAGKIILKQNKAGFSEDYGGGFSRVFNDRSGKSLRQRFGTKGNFITDDWRYYYDQRSGDLPKFISKRKSKYGLVDIQENVLIPFESDTLYTPDNRYYVSRKKGRFSLLDSKNNTLLSGFDGIEWQDLSNNYNRQLLFVLAFKGRKKVYDDNLRLLMARDFDEAKGSPNHIIAKNGNSWSAYTLSGKFLFSVEADKLTDFWKPFFEFAIDGKQGLLSGDGKIALPALYSQVYPFSLENRFVVQNAGFKTLIDASGAVWVESFDRIEPVYPRYFDAFSESAGLFFSVTDTSGKAALFDSQPKQVSVRDWDAIYSVVEDKFIIGLKNGKSGVATFNGRIIVPFEYDSVSDGRLRRFSARKNDVTYFFSPDGILIHTKK